MPSVIAGAAFRRATASFKFAFNRASPLANDIRAGLSAPAGGRSYVPASSFSFCFRLV